MSVKKIGRLIGAVAITGLVAIAPAFSGCNTAHPEAKITLEFNGTEYVLQYKMYRNMYPQTVQHFIELADNGFYDDTVVHNYSSTALYAGGYGYVLGDEEEEILGYVSAYEEGVDGIREYLETNSKEKEYSVLADPEAGVVTPSVYKDFIDGKYSQPLNTLIGEFANNQHKIEQGALKSSFGCLRMYYTSKTMDSVKNAHVYMDKQGSQAGVLGEYKYNSATSLFSIQYNTTVSTDSSYCIFAVLMDTTPLSEMKTAISEYAATIGTSKFTKSVSLYVDNYDEYVGANVNEVNYSVTALPIIVKSVQITKY